MRGHSTDIKAQDVSVASWDFRECSAVFPVYPCFPCGSQNFLVISSPQVTHCLCRADGGLPLAFKGEFDNDILCSQKRATFPRG